LDPKFVYEARSQQAPVNRSKGALETPLMLKCDRGRSRQPAGEPIMSKAIKVLAITTAAIIVTSASAFAQSPPPYWGSYGYPGEGGSLAPYGDANPSYRSYYGTYPAHSWDPDPNLRAQLRSDFNRGADGAPQ
jgi:hypothetical protein